jgi:predicted RNA-binding protein YlxR (DUF448 family)
VTAPERTCIGCRGRGEKGQLLRLVNRATVLVVDADQTEPGRGAYVHRRAGCVDLAVRRRAVGRALRTPSVDASQLGVAAAPFLDEVGSTA